LQASRIRLINARTHNCAAAAQTFGIDFTLFFAETGLLRQRTDDATGGTTSGRARQRCH
jgi:adenylosuccinate lyase